MLYSKRQLAVRHAASTEATRFNLNGVRFHADGSTEATNGHILCRITAKAPPLDEYPSPKGSSLDGAILEGEQEPFTFPIDAVNRLVKAIPKKAHFPILEHAALDVGASNANGSARFITTDLESTQAIEGRKIEGDFPDTGKVIPGGKPVTTLALNLTLLCKLEKALREFNGGKDAIANLEIHGPHTPVKLTASNPDVGEFLAVIMPMRV